jgi:hypothetical protein
MFTYYYYYYCSLLFWKVKRSRKKAGRPWEARETAMASPQSISIKRIKKKNGGKPPCLDRHSVLVYTVSK